ncbi:lipase maturation factor 2-like [Watersipora subatra]|uniref:lipase maturation factor 2-like n=1 Tax=Watersipora subatra TaxID=2589382 RepID=UPI00355AE91C
MASSKDIYLIGIAVVYLIAFTSLYVQVPGLYGDHGLLPVKNIVKGVPKTIADWFDQPSLIRYRYKYSMDTESAMDLCCLVGAFFSTLAVIFTSMRSSLVFFLLWVLYMSLYALGQTFLWFQWDILLLEAGFLAIIIAPLQLLGLPLKHRHDKMSMWLVKWLLFRLMFASGVVKLKSGCHTWWGLTALDWHFESQCIPTPPAWYFHHTPDWFKRFSNASVFIIQIAVSFLFFAPTRTLRIFSFYAQVFLQFLILFTGNYNFFNLLTIILCFSLLDDDDLSQAGARKRNSIVDQITSMLSSLFTLLVFAILIVCSYKYFGIHIKEGVVSSEINFTKQGFNVYVRYATGVSIWLAIASLAWEMATCLYRCATEERGFVRIIYSVVSTVGMSLIVIYMFSLSLVPHTELDSEVRGQLPPPILHWHSQTDSLQLVNSYGLFRSMTGIGGRPEVVVMGSSDRTNWKEYEFLYKPGQLDRAPPVVAPHQPRLDWQMWFAALGSYQHNYWFVVMLYRLLDNEPVVLDLLQSNPFSHKAPQFIKAQLYTYHYSTMTENRNWWRRDPNPKEYTPILTKDDLTQYLTDRKILPVKARYKPYGQLDSGLRHIRSLVRGIDHFILVTGVTLFAISSSFLLRMAR